MPKELYQCRMAEEGSDGEFLVPANDARQSDEDKSSGFLIHQAYREHWDLI